jgi:hypothetical protein
MLVVVEKEKEGKIVRGRLRHSKASKAISERECKIISRKNSSGMCGTFGFAGKKPLSLTKVFRVLQKLEVSQYPGEPRPVGGHGAGVAALLDDGSVLSEKIGKMADSPACQLAEIMKANLSEASVLIGHVRFPSAEFIGTAKFKRACALRAQNVCGRGGIRTRGLHDANVAIIPS